MVGALHVANAAVQRGRGSAVRCNRLLAASKCAICFDMLLKAIRYRLPTVLLLLDGMGLLAVKCDPYRYAVRTFVELDPGFPISEVVFDQAVFHNFGVGTFKVESEAAVLGLHPRTEPPTRTEIDGRLRCMPVIRSRIPLNDVFRVAVRFPYRVRPLLPWC